MFTRITSISPSADPSKSLEGVGNDRKFAQLFRRSVFRNESQCGLFAPRNQRLVVNPLAVLKSASRRSLHLKQVHCMCGAKDGSLINWITPVATFGGRCFCCWLKFVAALLGRLGLLRTCLASNTQTLLLFNQRPPVHRNQRICCR